MFKFSITIKEDSEDPLNLDKENAFHYWKIWIMKWKRKLCYNYLESILFNNGWWYWEDKVFGEYK